MVPCGVSSRSGGGKLWAVVQTGQDGIRRAARINDDCFEPPTSGYTEGPPLDAFLPPALRPVMKHPLIFALALFLPSALVAADQDPAGIEFFEKKIRPVLVKHCYECHSQDSKSLKGGLLLDTRDGIRAGGDSGPSVVPNKVDASLLLDALRYESFEMPPSGRLPDKVIADFEQWVALGAPDPRDGPATRNPDEHTGIDFEKARSEHWAFQPPQSHPQPDVAQPALVRKPLDAFVLAQLDAAKLTPNSPADRRTLIRRVYFAVLGLPPSVDEVEEFVNDDSDIAYEQLVERLLSSPHYGERLGRMWLDVSRYAEDQAHIVGNNKSLFYPNAYLYRDWLIQALNNDMPYDDFVRLQLAADSIAPDDATNRPALGFIGLGPKYYRRNDPEVMADEWENHIDTIGRGLLGLTVACARCHDHKYDPIPTSDYYALAGVFASTEMFNRPLEDAQPEKADGKDKDKKKKNGPETSLHVVRDKNPRDINVQIRGDVKNQGPVAKRAFLTVLSPEGPIELTDGSGRRQLADAIVDRNNPLTARVIVNRVWGLLFGRGLVSTPSNFGILSEPPTHPKLLDDLSVRFMDNGWSLKWLYREILLSSTWRQSSDIDSGKQAADPSNMLLWRMERRRLDVESWRDSILTVAGRLDDTIGGKSIEPTDPEQTRRTVYARISRLDLNPMLAMFDFPDPNAHAARRVETTTPLQKMFVLNSPFMIRQATALSERCIDAADSDEARIHWACRTLFGRDATAEEVELGLAYIGELDEGHTGRWEQFAQVLLASNEMLMID